MYTCEWRIYIYIYMCFLFTCNLGCGGELCRVSISMCLPGLSHTATGAVQLADCAALIASFLQSFVDAAQGPPDV